MRSSDSWRAIAMGGLFAVSIALPLACGQEEGTHSTAGGEAGMLEVAGAGGSAESGSSGESGAASLGSVPCITDATCRPLNQLCDLQHYVCVDCLASSSCGAEQVCSGGVCRSFTHCTDSRQCPADSVCDPDAHFCVECVTDADCAKAQLCVNSQCHDACNSEPDCSNGQVCNVSKGYCTECLSDVDCDVGRYCSVGACEAQVCTPSSTLCRGDQLLTCDALGDGFSAQVCAAGCSELHRAHCLPNGDGAGGHASAGGAP